MQSLFWWLLWIAGFIILAYCNTTLTLASTLLIAGFLITLFFSPLGWFSLLILLCIVTATVVFLQFPQQRQAWFTRPLLQWFQKRLPKMSETETIALEAGTVNWDGDLFSGNPRWSSFFNLPAPKLTIEEQAFLEGPTETLCQLLNDWEITAVLQDLPKKVWDFLKNEGFFGIIIPKNYGGLGFSAVAHSEILSKIASCSLTAASTVAVPNSLGPAELIYHYGTTEQQEYYLPRLAKGIEIPCFALTHRDAGSDATAIPDTGIICRDKFEGQEILGIRLNWEKRYITLAPIATLLGLAFKLYDPDQLLGSQTELGITCALVPTHLPGITIGNRHKPLATPFQNGPTSGKNVFIPLDWIIGGPKMAGQGWRMLVACLSTGRAISLPSSATGCAKMLCAATTAYARIRKQFKQPIGKFGGIQEVLARMAANTYAIDALRLTTAVIIDGKQSPAVLGAISKCYTTEYFRRVTLDAMDIHGGKGIMLGPKNYTANQFMGAPISITVEGANILTRSMIIFGQGVMRSHPYILQEIQAAKMSDQTAALQAFDKALLSHLGYTLRNAARAFVSGFIAWWPITWWPNKHPRHQQHQPHQYIHSTISAINRASSAFALTADVCMLLLGGKLKFKENISGRFSDMLAMMYITSCVLKRHADQGHPKEDKPLIFWILQDCLQCFWERMEALLQNFPIRWVGILLKCIVMPLGKPMKQPSDALTAKLAQELITNSSLRARLIQGIYFDLKDLQKPQCQMEKVFLEILAAEEEGAKKESVEIAEKLRKEILNVDQFAPAEF